MKIEMGESLVISWLKHIKNCQLVQGNWKPSRNWMMINVDKVTDTINDIDGYFKENFSSDFKDIFKTDMDDIHWAIFKQNVGIEQILTQGEADAIGVSYQDGDPYPYSVDVAFHSGGLNYGSAEVSTMKVLEKMARTVVSLYGYMGFQQGEVIFASPKINNNVMNLLSPATEKLQELLKSHNLIFKLRVISGESFKEVLLDPVIQVADSVKDTSELFMRAYQLYSMFYKNSVAKVGRGNLNNTVSKARTERRFTVMDDYGLTEWKELKVGQLANIKLRKMLEEGAATLEEVADMQKSEYSKETFGLNFPLLRKAVDGEQRPIRYYAKALKIHDEMYYLCSEWFEVPNNNDRPFLEKWIALHKQD